MPKKNRIKTDDLGHFMAYILGHKPYEFGLVPDSEGFISYKELLWAIHEEPGWGYVRQRHINEVLLGKHRILFQSEDKRIRAIERRWNHNFEIPAQSLPKILFLGIRRSAHPFVMEKGLCAIGGTYYALSPERKMAERMGKRRDQKPVLLEITADVARKGGVLFYPFGNLFLTSEISVRYIAGPLVTKDVVKGSEAKSKKKKEPLPNFQAGTFALDLNRDVATSHKSRGRMKKGWKEETRMRRRQRNRIS